MRLTRALPGLEDRLALARTVDSDAPANLSVVVGDSDGPFAAKHHLYVQGRHVSSHRSVDELADAALLAVTSVALGDELRGVPLRAMALTSPTGAHIVDRRLVPSMEGPLARLSREGFARIDAGGVARVDASSASLLVPSMHRVAAVIKSEGSAASIDEPTPIASILVPPHAVETAAERVAALIPMVTEPDGSASAQKLQSVQRLEALVQSVHHDQRALVNVLRSMGR